jgi:hypothetical protein
MRLSPLLPIAVLVLAAGPSAGLAQNRECAPLVLQPQARNVCNAAVDGTRTFHPLAGGLVSGGNPVIGRAATLGGFGHAALTVRANAGSISVPDLEFDGTSTTVEQEDEIVFPAPLVEAAVGIWRGLPGGLLAVDALGSALLLPDEIDDLHVDPDAASIGGVALGLGYGARLGIFPGSGLIPAVSLSVMRRGIPRVQYGDIGAGDDYSYSVDLAATSVRLVAGSTFGPLAVAAGVGRDRYTGDALVRFRDPATAAVIGEAELELDESRTMLFADAGLSLGLVALVGEVGWQSGTDADIATTFEGFDPEEGMVFAGLGLRVGF